MPGYAIPRPTSGDIIDLILDDHRFVESLLRDLRTSPSDRAAARACLAAVLVAHAEAEQSAVYPKLARRAEEVGAEEVEHGHKEHAEGNRCLLELLEAKGTTTQKFEDAVNKLSAYLYHHICEEELTILGPAREQVGDKERREIGAGWLATRGELLDGDCGSAENVRRLVDRDVKAGIIREELPEHPGH
ncbi:MAG TPA: hemerythrin domain-containing protein [Dermatophilaceae bacterium]|nr:hemerythrin domain-containing protein [Dermatophilaceae bacterium]